MQDLPSGTVLEIGGLRGEALYIEMSDREVHVTLLTDTGMAVKTLSREAFERLLEPLDDVDAEALLSEPSETGDQETGSTPPAALDTEEASSPERAPSPPHPEGEDPTTPSPDRATDPAQAEAAPSGSDPAPADEDDPTRGASTEDAPGHLSARPTEIQEPLTGTSEEHATSEQHTGSKSEAPLNPSRATQEAEEGTTPVQASAGTSPPDPDPPPSSPTPAGTPQPDPETAPKPASDIISQDLEPRPYQQDAIEAWHDAGGIGMLNMATGTGKTLTALFAMAQLWPEVRTVLVVCPTRILVEQWQEEIRRVFPHAAIFEHGDTDAWRQAGPLPDGPTFLIGTYHGLYRRSFADWYATHIDPTETAVLLDEVHRAGSTKYSNVLDLPAAYRLGLSATPHRDWDIRGNQRLEAALQGEVYQFGLGEAIKNDFLTPYTYHLHVVPLTPEEREGYSEISVKIQNILQVLGYDPEKHDLPTFLQRLEDKGDERAEVVRQLLIKRTVYHKEAFGKETYLHDILDAHDFERCLVYCNTQRHVDRYRRALQAAGKSVAFYTSQLDQAQRRQALRAFEKGHIDFLISIRCLDEGVDIPTCESAIVASSSTTTREFIQRRGRLLRTAPNKAQAAIHDLLVLPVDPQTTQTEIATWETSLIKKELRRAYIFNEQALNRSENETFLRDLAQALELPFPGDIVDDVDLEARMEIWNQDLNRTEWGDGGTADMEA